MPAEYLGRAEGHTNGVTEEYAVANGVTLTTGDFVYPSGDRVTNASIAGKKLLGTVVGGDSKNLAAQPTNSRTATGDAAGTVRVLVNVERDARYLLQSDQVGTTLAATHVGQYFDLIGSGGAQLVDSSTVSQTTGQLVLKKFNPGIRGTGAAYGIFRIAENQNTVDDIGAS